MQLFGAILLGMLRSLLIVFGLMVLLFFGHLVIDETGPTVQELLTTPQRLDELKRATLEHGGPIAESIIPLPPRLLHGRSPYHSK